MPESEETRVTDAEELTAAATAVAWLISRSISQPPPHSFDAQAIARAALEAAAALHPPREGAEGRYREALERIANDGKPWNGPADWDAEQEAWVCQAHGMPDCVQAPPCIAAIAVAALSEEAENG